MQTTARNATLQDLAALLTEQHARKVDVVASAPAIRSEDGVIVVKDAETILGEDGVTTVDGRYQPSRVMDEGIADKLGIPVTYLRRLRETRPDLYDANVNAWLHGRKPKVRTAYGPEGHVPTQEVIREGVPADPRKFLVRGFTADDTLRNTEGGTGYGRAFLSDTFRVIDHLDVLTAALDGIRETGLDVEIESADLTDRRMMVRLVAPEVTALAPVLLRGYRSPFTDPEVERAGGWTVDRALAAAAREGQAFDEGTEPVVWAGLVLSNSETGGGAFSITPRMSVRVCKNGLTITKDALRKTHLGARMDEGIVRWSDDTQAKNLSLVTAQARDAVKTFLDVDYMTRTLTRIEDASTAKVTDATTVVAQVGKSLGYTSEQQAGILDHFIRGGQMTAGGVLNAVTSYAQTVPDGDTAADLEASALRAMEVVAG
jgi:hypothetical protein